ncbi:hypothetical protein FHX44_116696 [Pseudonocardia hierapolitana]|uniref:Uncharacterized protein n=1 Tax=Pseudonocardia hierapolitana TaxID=1128676 RepID=A0A561T0X9_9PSEU|nr:hypothetical protein [Pseudonocardia hierapolitana]TWF80753.1 hypothetical protein FHX44_116696 [Pseudonocardia hierapolitana]
MRSTRAARRIAVRATATAAFGLVLAATLATPAVAAEAGVITKPFGYNYPTENACDDQGQTQMAQQNADDYACYRQSDNTWDGYLMWYT